MHNDHAVTSVHAMKKKIVTSQTIKMTSKGIYQYMTDDFCRSLHLTYFSKVTVFMLFKHSAEIKHFEISPFKFPEDQSSCYKFNKFKQKQHLQSPKKL